MSSGLSTRHLEDYSVYSRERPGPLEAGGQTVIGERSYAVAYSPIVVSGLVRYPYGLALRWHCVHVHRPVGKHQRPGGGADGPGDPMCATDVRGNAPGWRPAMVSAARRPCWAYGAAALCATRASYLTAEMKVRRDHNAVAEQPPCSAQPPEDTPW